MLNQVGVVGQVILILLWSIVRKELNKAFDSLANDIGNQDDGLRENSDLDDAFGITAAYKDKQKKFMIDLLVILFHTKNQFGFSPNSSTDQSSGL